MSELIITNGDAAVSVLGEAGLGGRIIPWADVLHEGPLVPGASLEDHSKTRAEYLSKRFGISLAETRSDLLARDAVVKAHGLFDRVSIWLEHDLYDQLQLLQILHFFEGERRSEGLRVVQADDFLATQKPETVLRFADNPVEMTPALLQIAGSIWRALTSPSPEALVVQLRSPTGPFRFVRPALGRFIEELPSVQGGLSRSERIILGAVANGPATPRDVFHRLLASEDAAFMGDWSAFRIVDDLVHAAEPLIEGPEELFPCQGSIDEAKAYVSTPLNLTKFGRAVLTGEADMIAVNSIDRWWAGTHLSGHDCWRWETKTRRVVPPGGGQSESGD